jgi:anti-sigma factor RsiW
MEHNPLLNDDLLWDYADGFLSPEEKAQADDYLQRHPEVRQRLNVIEAEKKALFSLPLEKPNPGFADRVMAAWAVEQVHVRASKSGGRDWIVMAVAAVFGVFILVPFVLLVGGLLQNGAPEPSFQMPQIPAVDLAPLLSAPFVRYGLYLTLAFLTLRLIDRYLHKNLIVNNLKLGF